jgi:hypothetical protein
MANNTRIKINERLLKLDIYKYAQNFSERVAVEASRSISNFAQTAIAIYYGGYSPFNYIRTGQLANDSYSPFVKKVKNEYQGGIIIDTSNVNYPSHGPNVSTDEIVPWSWTQGFHGVYYGNKESMYNGTEKINLYNSYGHGYIMGKPDIKPYDWVRKNIYNKKFIEKMAISAKDFARKQTYNVLHF